jgi:hypothetical protein
VLGRGRRLRIRYTDCCAAWSGQPRAVFLAWRVGLRPCGLRPRLERLARRELWVQPALCARLACVPPILVAHELGRHRSAERTCRAAAANGRSVSVSVPDEAAGTVSRCAEIRCLIARPSRADVVNRAVLQSKGVRTRVPDQCERTVTSHGGHSASLSPPSADATLRFMARCGGVAHVLVHVRDFIEGLIARRPGAGR